MSLLGIDIGTTGCKAIAFSEGGAILASAYAEYDISRPEPRSAELDAAAVWAKVRSTIREAATRVSGTDPVRALSVASMGEAVVPVSADRRILGPSILINDARGDEYLERIRGRLADLECYRITGNPIGAQFGLTKLMWIKEHRSELYRETYKFLNWGGFVEFMLGAEPRVDYSLANRFLLFDLASRDWSPRLLAVSGLDREKLPDCVPAGTVVGTVAREIAGELGLAEGVLVVCGPHDQCANALGCGAIRPGEAMYGMGTFPTILAVHDGRSDPARMLSFGLNTEHHAAPGAFVSFAYHMGGSIVKWYRDTFAAAEARSARERGADVYEELFAELPEAPGPLLVLPHFAPMGPPDYLSDSSGVILGLRSYTKRGEILKAILEGNMFALKVSVDNLASIGVDIASYRAVGGGSRTAAAVQLCADILDRPFARPAVAEAGALGVAILAGLASGAYESPESAVGALVRIERRFDPDPKKARRYAELFEVYQGFSEKVVGLAREWTRFKEGSDLD
jgi:xylulokinase